MIKKTLTVILTKTIVSRFVKTLSQLKIRTLKKQTPINNKPSSNWLVKCIQQGIDMFAALLLSIKNESNNILNLTNQNRSNP